MPSLGNLWYTLGIDSKQLDAELKSAEAKLKNLGVTVDVSTVRKTIEAAVGATPFNATVDFGNARASLDAIFVNKKYDIHVEAIASKLHDSIKNALANFSTGTNILPKKKELRKAVNDALLSAGFEINVGKVKGLNATINNVLGSAHTLNVSVDPKKLAAAIDKAVGSYKGGKQISVEAKDKILKDSIRAALRTEKFPIRVIVDKAEAQDAVRQALQAAGLQSRTGFTASDKRAWDAQSRRMEAEARAAAASALAQRRLAGAQRQAANAADSHTKATVSLNSALKGNLTITKELGGAIGAAYSVVALKNFMTKVVEIGGELEQQKLAMKAILGDEGMANTISSQINTLAVKSPFGIMELNQYAKQLTAFQIPYNELYDTMKRMADVSAAVGVDMGRIILAYGQVRAAKFLKGCLGKGTLVTMLNGSQKKVEDIVVGDVVMGDDEKGRNVLSLIRNREMMYVVSYHGGSFRCNENHILTMYDRETDKIVDVYVLDYLKDADKYLGVRRVNGTYEYFGMTVKRDCVDDYYGFEIDGNKRFLIKDNVVTHNTELRQFTEANIPLIDMLADRFTKLKGEIVSAGDIMDMISNKEVSFEDVKAALWELTGEGGRFYNMQEVLSESTKAKWENLADAIDLMFADIAKETSGPLKTTAEILTELTSKWELIATTVATASLAFGTTKAVLLLFNRGLSTTTANAIKGAESQALLERRNLRLAQSYRDLTAAETAALTASKQSVFSGLISGKSLSGIKNLTDGQTKQLILSRQISKEEWKRLVAMGKLTQRQKAALVVYGGISREELRSIRNLKGMQLLWAKIRFTAASVGRAIAGFVFNPATLITAGIAAMAALWEKNNEEMQRAKEFGKELETQGSEASRNLAESLKAIPKAATGTEAMQTLEKLQQLVKDYSSIPDKVLDLSQFKDDGTIRTTAEQIEYLRGELKKLKAANDALSEKGEEYGAVVKATDGGWFDDDVITDINDWANAVDAAKGEYLKFVTEYEKDAETIVATAAKEDAAYRESIKGMNRLIDKFSELMNNREKYSKGFNAAIEGNRWKLGGGFKGFIGISDGVLQSSIVQVRAYSEMIAEIQESVNAFKKLHPDWDWNKLDSTQEEIIRKYFNGFIQKAQDAGPEAQKQLQSIISNILNFDITGMSGELMIANEMRDKLPQILGKELADKVVNGLKLTKEEQNKVDEAIQTTYLKMFSNADKLTREALSKAVSIDGKTFDLTKLAGIRARFDITADWDSWKRELNQKYDGDPTIQAWVKGAPDYLSFIKAVQDGYKEAQTAVDKLKPVLIKAKLGFDFQMGDLLPEGVPSTWYMSLSETQKRNVQDYNKFIRAVKSAQKVGKEEGFDPAAEYNKGHKGFKGSQKDEFAEAIKERINLLKKAKSEYESLAKLVGTETASKELADSPIFAGLKANKFLPEQAIPKTLDDYEKALDELQENLSAKGLKTKKHRELNVEIEQVKFDINKKKTEEALKLALDKVTKEAERQLENWNLYDKIRKATGDKQLAMNLAFGVGVEGQTDYESLIKDKFNAIAKAYKSTLTFDTATPELLAKAPEEVRKAWEQAYSEIRKYRDKEREEVADMVAQYRTTQEEIVALTAEAEEKKRKIRESKDLTPAEKEQITAKIDADLNYEVFRKSGEYLKFFNAILSMTDNEAEKVGQKIKEALDDKLKAGQISAKDYCDEMEKIDKQLEKIRQKQKGFGGLGSFVKGGLQQMFKDRFEQAQSDYNAATQNFDTAKQQFDLFSKEGNEAGMQQAQSAMDAASAMKEGAASAMQGAQGAMQTMAVIDTIVHGINDTVQGIKGSFDLIADLADSMGIDTGADTDWGKAGAFLDAFSQASQHATDAWDSLKSGNVGGVIQGVIGSITSWFTTFNRWHDAKLQAQIEKSKQIVQNIQYAYNAIERRMGNFLGNAKNLPVFAIDEAKKELDDLDKDIQSKQDKLAKMDGFAAKGTAIGTTVGGALGGIFGAAIGGLAGGIADLVNHSKKKKLEKELNKLYEERARLVARIEAYQEGGALSLQRQMMKEQLEELEKQKKAEEGKKKVDKAAVKDYEDQIDELTVKIQEFGIEMAKEIYGIDLNSWAEQLGDALVDAFAAGEDAAEAFDNTVSDIMRSLVGKMLTQDLIAPMFDDVRDYLFGENGVYSKGATGGDFEMSEEDAIGLAEKLAGMKGIVEDAKAIYDQINAATDGMLDDKESKSGLSAGIQSVTEDTADLLASYLNTVRADVLIQTYELWPRLLDVALPQISVIAQSQLDAQRQIAENTLRAAKAAEAIVKSNDDISHLLVRVTQGGDKFYVQ